MLFAEFEAPSFASFMLTIAFMMFMARVCLKKVDAQGEINSAAKEKVKSAILKWLK